MTAVALRRRRNNGADRTTSMVTGDRETSAEPLTPAAVTRARAATPLFPAQVSTHKRPWRRDRGTAQLRGNRTFTQDLCL
jgi:hypothetical protein